uniref:Uncharacterized protein n=1 Tax=Rhizophora mucronata TaxID=61149 RepID=A0A2P2Q511_RHIMU
MGSSTLPHEQEIGASKTKYSLHNHALSFEGSKGSIYLCLYFGFFPLLTPNLSLLNTAFVTKI